MDQQPGDVTNCIAQIPRQNLGLMHFTVNQFQICCLNWEMRNFTSHFRAASFHSPSSLPDQLKQRQNKYILRDFHKVGIGDIEIPTLNRSCTHPIVVTSIRKSATEKFLSSVNSAKES
jgi:hypothetical protein